MIDEADTFLGEHEELRGILNSGHRRGGQVIRTVGDDHEPRAFSTHSPCAIAIIGKLPDTLADRSLTVSLKRRLPSEPISPFRADRIDALKMLARNASRWTSDHAGRLGVADPDLPDRIFNREADNWRPLFAIAMVAGGDWPERVKKAALAHVGVSEDNSQNVQLLADIRDVFAENGLTEDDNGMRSAELVAALIAMAERPWGECNRGKALTQNGLARRLKPFGICTGDVHVGRGREERRSFKGYALKSLKEACARYLPGFSSAPSRHGLTNNDLHENPSAPRANGGADQNSPNHLKSRVWRGGAVQKGENGACTHVDYFGAHESDDPDEYGADAADAKSGAQTEPENPASINWWGRA